MSSWGGTGGVSWDSPSVESDEAETELGSSFSSRWNEAVVKKKIRSRKTTSIIGVIMLSSDVLPRGFE
jgi:hypothetical protein